MIVLVRIGTRVNIIGEIGWANAHPWLYRYTTTTSNQGLVWIRLVC